MKKLAGLFVAASLIGFGVSAPAMASAEPELVEASAPSYPRAAERRSIEGHVVVRYNVTAEGSVADVEFVESMPEGIFDAAVERALGDWQSAASGDGFAGIERRFDFNFGD